MLQDVRYKEYCRLVRYAHKRALDRKELARLPLEERMAMQQAEAHSHAVKAMLANLKVTQNPTTSAAVVDESKSRDQQASFASLPESPMVAAKCGLLHFADLHTVEQAFHEWPKIESHEWRLREVGGHLQNKAKTTTTRDGTWSSASACLWM